MTFVAAGAARPRRSLRQRRGRAVVSARGSGRLVAGGARPRSRAPAVAIGIGPNVSRAPEPPGSSSCLARTGA